MKVFRIFRKTGLKESDIEERDFSESKIVKLGKISKLLPMFYNDLFKLLMLNEINDKRDFNHWCTEITSFIDQFNRLNQIPTAKVFSPVVEDNADLIIDDKNFINLLSKLFGDPLPKSHKEFGKLILRSVKDLREGGKLKYFELIKRLKKDIGVKDDDLVDLFLRKVKYLVLILTKQINPDTISPWDNEVITTKVNWKKKIKISTKELRLIIENIEDYG